MNGGMCYQPLYDRDFEATAVEWLAENAAWENGTDADRTEWESKEGERKFYWEWNGHPPDRECYRPKWSDEERTAFQMYETVSEGTPVTPVFETKAALVDYLVANGCSWDQWRAAEHPSGDGPGWSRESAERFVENEYAPSLVVFSSKDGIEIKEPRNQ